MSIYSTGIDPLIQKIINTSNSLSNYISITSNILEKHSSNNIALSANFLQEQITSTCNLIYRDSNLNTVVKITAQNPFYPVYGKPVETQFQNVNGDYLTKISQTGELMVYHPSTPLPAGYSAGWWGVENKIATGITDSQGLRFDVTNLQAATGAAAITDTGTAAAAAAGAAGGLVSAGTATAAAGATIAAGDYGSVALGVAGGALFSVLGYLSYQAQVASNLSSNGFLIQASQIQSNINSAYVLLTDNISNICIGKGFINCNITKPQLIPNLYTNSLNLGLGNISNVNNINASSITTNQINLNSKVITTLGLKDIDNFIQTQYGTYFDVTNGNLAINATPTQIDFLKVGGQTTIQGILIAEGKIKENNTYLNDVYISSNQIYKKYDTYAIELQYPSKLYDTFTTQTATTFLGQASYQESITLNNTGISYGVGQYDIYVSSSGLMSNRAGKQLFNYVLNEEADSCHFLSVYNASGFYTGTADYINSGYYGDWVVIKLPNPIILTKFSFYMRPTIPTRAPSLWKCYGSIDGITFIEIVEASNTTALTSGNYTSSKYEKILNTTFNTPYIYWILL